MAARRSCAWIYIHPNTGPSTKCNPTRPSPIFGLKTLIIESKESHLCHTEDNEELRSKCIRLETELEFAN